MSIEHYIIVRVREEHPAGNMTDMARVRRAMHDVTDEYGLKVWDMVLRGDRGTDVIGRDIRADRDIVRSIFDSSWAAWRAYAAARPVKQKPKSAGFDQKNHRGRAMRALSIVIGYTEKYGDDLGLRNPVQKKGRHAR